MLACTYPDLPARVFAREHLPGGSVMTIERYGNRFFALYDADGSLVCVTVYKKGAEEVRRRLEQAREQAR
jgi:hypothetical protein